MNNVGDKINFSDKGRKVIWFKFAYFNLYTRFTLWSVADNFVEHIPNSYNICFTKYVIKKCVQFGVTKNWC